MPVLAGQWARQSVNLPLRIRLFTTHKLTKSRFPSRVLCPSDHPSRETIQPFALPNIAGSVEGLQGAALRTRGGAGARLQAGARVCNVGSAWRAAVAGSSRWRRGCRPGWPAAPVRGARSHADSHLAAESATAGQSVRRIQAPTGHSARWLQNSQQRCYLQPHVVQGLSALSVMLGADRTTARSDYRPADTTRRATRSCAPHS